MIGIITTECETSSRNSLNRQENVEKISPHFSLFFILISKDNRKFVSFASDHLWIFSKIVEKEIVLSSIRFEVPNSQNTAEIEISFGYVTDNVSQTIYEKYLLQGPGRYSYATKSVPKKESTRDTGDSSSFSIHFSGMRLSVYRLVHVTGLGVVREHVRGGAYACTQAPRDASTDLRLLPPRIHHHPTDLYISRRVSHFRHYHSCRGCANPWARKRESALGFPPRSFRAGWSRAPTPILSPHVFSPRFSTNGGNASCGAFVSRLVSVRFPRKLVSRTNRSIVNAGTRSSRVVPFNSLDILFLLGVEREKKESERKRERERVSIAIEVFFSFLFVFFYPRAARVSWEMCATCSEPASSPATPTEWD